MWVKQPGLTEKTYRLTDITEGEDRAVSVTVKAMLMEIELDGGKAYVPVITQPDLNNRTKTTITRRLNGWLG